MQLARLRSFQRFSGVLLSLVLLSVLLTACGDSNTPAAVTTSATNAGVTSGTSSSLDTSKPIRIGYQKGGTLVLLKSQGTLEKAFGGQVQWIEFPAGPQLLEALNTGNIDIGSVGDSPPVFAQAAGTPLVYVAAQPGDPTGQGILVPQNSPIKTIADLKGKKIAYQSGSSANFLLIQALAEASLKITDVQSLNLAPGDARVAFEGGQIDAWVIWDPFFTLARQTANARLLRDGTNLSYGRGFYIASQDFVKNRPAELKLFLQQIQQVNTWAQAHLDDVAKFIAPQIGVDVSVEQQITHRANYKLLPMTDQIVSDEQKVADTFYEQKIIPKQVSIKEATWQGSWQ